jgi:[acyl-carrier-protein] S-malonyltransferase
MQRAQRALTFPGQGSQAVGMGRELAEAFASAREVFEEVNDALGQNLSRLMWEGSEADLTLTENAQPALMAVSLAVTRVLEREAGLDVAQHCRFVAGHSLGEYSALAAAGALDVADAARLLRTRGRAMQEAVPVGEGAMAALLGIDLDAVAEKVLPGDDADGVCVIANDNAPGQVVISGAAASVEAACARAREAGAKKAVMLAVSAPFHSPLMQPAADVMREALETVIIAPPAVALVANVTAAPVREPETIRGLLVAQVTSRVRWRESVLFMAGEGVDTLVELGAGRVLGTMAKRIERSLALVNVETPQDVEAFARTL